MKESAGGLPAAQTKWAYFFDIDGTLVDFAASPARVRLDRELRPLLRRLHRSAGGAVALISGRSIADIDRLFPGECLPVAGQHGIERRDAMGRVATHAFSGPTSAVRSRGTVITRLLPAWRSDRAGAPPVPACA